MDAIDKSDDFKFISSQYGNQILTIRPEAINDNCFGA